MPAGAFFSFLQPISEVNQYLIIHIQQSDVHLFQKPQNQADFACVGIDR